MLESGKRVFHQMPELVVVISQSGETADTMAALEHAKAQGHCHTLAICNVPESSLVRATALSFITRAGPEIGVASTKAFTTQLSALFVLILLLANMPVIVVAPADSLLEKLKANMQEVRARCGQLYP
jgi:glucosamine--fructose-6-phosphate aminotransferase (isomerizing)